MSDANEKLVRDFVALWATRDAAGMANTFAEDGVYDNVPQNKPMVGRDTIRAWLDMCFQHLTRIDVDVLQMASKGEWVLSERLDTHVMGDKKMPLPVMNACRIVNGKIVMFRDYYDHQTVVQLGMA